LLYGNNRRMTDRWEGIDAFTAVAETGSFTRAAALLGLSVSQVSREISRLEARLGLLLLKRTTRRVSVTETGSLFEQRCRRMIAERDSAFEDLTTHVDDVGGHLRLTCPVAYGERTIAPIVNRFMEAFPRISIHIELSNAVRDILSEGFDVAIRVDDAPDRRLARAVLTSRKLYCCASPDYLRRAGIALSVADLDDHACLLGSAPNWRFTSDGHEVLISPVARWRCNSGFAVAEAALHGLGICQLPDFYVTPHLTSGALVEILEDNRPRDQEIIAVHSMNTRNSKAVLALVDFIRSSLNDPVRTATALA
jgi:DNA-binding transcriptional LysR family regulator